MFNRIVISHRVSLFCALFFIVKRKRAINTCIYSSDWKSLDEREFHLVGMECGESESRRFGIAVSVSGRCVVDDGPVYGAGAVADFQCWSGTLAIETRVALVVG